MKIWTHTFGCKVNQYETALLRARMRADEHGAEPGAVLGPEAADLCVINTCSVTASADKEARRMIRRVLRVAPAARVIVTGCYATRAPAELRALSPRVEVVTNDQKEALPTCAGFEVAEQPLGIRTFAGRARAFVKIQDGCHAPCRYCIIPTVRPTLQSKPPAEVIAEVAGLVAEGYEEIVLTGIRLGLYDGRDRNGAARPRLTGLLERLLNIPGRFRVRLSSLEVTEVGDDLLQLMRGAPRLCRHLHVPLQSGDDAVLRSMGRWYTAAAFRDRLARMHAELPDCGITTDVMVGYPTETEEAFENTRALLEEGGFSGLHVFRFSPREGTAAAALTPLAPQVLSRRAAILAKLDVTLRQRFARRFRGTAREVLVEPTGEGWTDNYVRIGVPREQPPGLAVLPVRRVVLRNAGRPGRGVRRRKSEEGSKSVVFDGAFAV